MEKRATSFDEYLAGGFLANAPLLLFTYIVKSFWPDTPSALSLEVSLTLAVALGGVAAGYLVSRRTRRDFLRTGLKVGVSSFIVNFAFSSLVLGGATIPYGMWTLFLFCCTTVIGSHLARITSGETNPASEGDSFLKRKDEPPASADEGRVSRIVGLFDCSSHCAPELSRCRVL